ncbi:MAG: hybrid sensor histidine kinase/response regulator [Minicystis sp.]
MPVPTLRAGCSRYTAGVAPDTRPPTLEELPEPACLLVAPDGRVGWHNAGFGVWAGRADAAGTSLGELFPGDAAVAHLWEEARANGAVEHHVERRGPDGAASFWSVRARRTAGGVLVCATDSTAFAEAAHALHAVQRSFVGAAAHELRAPLSAIKAWASALSARRRGAGKGDDDSLSDDGLTAIARQVDRMNEMLSDLLDAARSDAGALRAARVAVPVGELMARARDAAPAGGRVTLGALPDARVLVDPRHLEAALARLVACVARRQPEGPIAITAERAGAEIHVLVTDGGPPLAPAAEADLFGRIARPGRGRGVGIGLHVVQLLAAGSGGRVWLERAAGGVRFVLALPEGDGPPDAGGARAAEPARPQGPLRALLVLRDQGVLARAASILRLYGHHVVTAAQLAGADGFDLVLVDPLHPAASGVAAVEALRARPDPPVVLVTAPAGARPESLVGVERAGALAVLPEPIDWAHLLALVQTVGAARHAV